MRKGRIGTGLFFLATIGVLGATAAIGISKRNSENSMPISYSSSECEEIMLGANRLEMHEVPFTWGNRYNVIVGGKRVGTVDERVFNWGKRFDFYAGSIDGGRRIGHAQEKILSFGHQSTVYDQNNREVGRLDEVVLSLNPGHLIEIYDAWGKKVAVSDERLSWTHATTIYDGNKSRAVGGTQKSFFWDDYSIEINNQMDRRLVLALVAMEDKLDDERQDDSSDDSD
jgi:uncharacterized protein YxjI